MMIFATVQPALWKVKLELAYDLGRQATDFDGFQKECCGGAHIAPGNVNW